jgi:hypothetical protein
MLFCSSAVIECAMWIRGAEWRKQESDLKSGILGACSHLYLVPCPVAVRARVSPNCGPHSRCLRKCSGILNLGMYRHVASPHHPIHADHTSAVQHGLALAPKPCGAHRYKQACHHPVFATGPTPSEQNGPPPPARQLQGQPRHQAIAVFYTNGTHTPFAHTRSEYAPTHTHIHPPTNMFFFPVYVIHNVVRAAGICHTSATNII